MTFCVYWQDVGQDDEQALLKEAVQQLQAHLEGYVLEHPNINYYYYTVGTDKDRNGPVKFDELAALYKRDIVHLETYVWHKLLGDKWIKLKNNGVMLDALRTASLSRPSSRFSPFSSRPSTGSKSKRTLGAGGEMVVQDVKNGNTAVYFYGFLTSFVILCVSCPAKIVLSMTAQTFCRTNFY